MIAPHRSRWRAGRALLAHELREQGPLGLALLVCGVALLLVTRAASGAEIGEVGERLPYVVPALATLLVAFAAAELFARDPASGLARVLAAAPVGRVRVMVPRLAVLGLIAAVLTTTLLTLEPAVRRGDLGASAAYAHVFAPAVLVVALTGAVLRSATGALVAGGLVYSAVLFGLAALTRLSLEHPTLGAAARVFAEAFLGAASAASLIPSGVAALFVATTLRGASARHWTRRLMATVAAAAVFVAPAALRAAYETHATIDVPFDDPEARVGMKVSPLAIGCRDSREILVRLGARLGPWSSSWAVDTATGARRRIGTHLSPTLVAGPGEAGFSEFTNIREGGCMVRLRFASGSTSDAMRLRAFSHPGVTSPPDMIALVDEASVLSIVSLIDGATRVLPDVRLTEPRVWLQLSPDRKWLVVYEPDPRDSTAARRGIDRLHLVDVTAGRIVQTVEGCYFRAWQRGERPLVVFRAGRCRAPGDAGELLSVAPDGAQALPSGEDPEWILDLDAGQYLMRSCDDALTVHAPDGTLVRTLRNPSPSPVTER